jgi:hypothetical protein
VKAQKGLTVPHGPFTVSNDTEPTPDLRHGRVTPFGYYYGMKQMISRRRFKQSESLKDRFISKVRRLCEEAKTLSRREEGETKERHQRNDQK